jgi:hypothetical protein
MLNQILTTVAFWFWVVILFFILLFIVSIFLKIALALVKAKNTEIGNVFGTALSCAVIMIIVIIISIIFFGFYSLLGIIFLIGGFIFCFVIIASRHEISFGKAILVTILAIVIGVLIIWVILVLLALI